MEGIIFTKEIDDRRLIVEQDPEADAPASVWGCVVQERTHDEWRETFALWGVCGDIWTRKQMIRAELPEQYRDLLEGWQ